MRELNIWISKRFLPYSVDPRSRSLSPVQSWLSQPRWCLASVYLRFLRCDTSWMLSFSPKSCMRKEYPLSSLEPTRLPCRHNVAKPAECWHVFKPQVFYTGREWTIHKQVHIWVESELMRLDVSAAVIAKLALECLRVPGYPVIWFLRLECKYDGHSAQFMEVWGTFLGVLLALPFFSYSIFFLIASILWYSIYTYAYPYSAIHIRCSWVGSPVPGCLGFWIARFQRFGTISSTSRCLKLNGPNACSACRTKVAPAFIHVGLVSNMSHFWVKAFWGYLCTWPLVSLSSDWLRCPLLRKSLSPVAIVFFGI